ncbi:hypothetical protein P7K49_020830, partial [Saguinus oedipus]
HGAGKGREGQGGGADPMAADPMEQRLGSLPVFTRDDFEGDWRQVASGGFSQVFQARHRHWRTEYAIKCAPCLPPGATRYLPAAPSPFSEEKLRPGKLWARELEREEWAEAGAEDCPPRRF